MTAKKQATKKTAKKPAKPKAPAPLIAYKGFDKDMKCRGFQFEVGKTYTHDGPVELCRAGFHACEHPMDVWSYYPLGESRYAVVELGGATDERSEDTKRVGSSLTVKAEIDIAGIVKAAVEWARTKAGPVRTASGVGSNLAASGVGSNLAASGAYSNLAASGEYSNLAASGDYSNLAASGVGSKLAASGAGSNLAASGEGGKLAASGEYSNLAASGVGSTLAASGEYSNLAASGESSNLAASGAGSIAAAAAYGCIAKAGPNGCIALAWHDGERPRIVVGYVGEGIEADTWYRVDAGKLVRA